MKCGFVSIVGRPNVGKSTLLNSLIGMKLAITSNVSGTTRNIIEGIYNDSDSQIVFVDTPGIHKPVHKLGNIMNKKSYNSVDGINAIMFLIDSTKGFGKGDLFILNRIKDKGVPILLILNKIDLIKDKKIMYLLHELKELQYKDLSRILYKIKKALEEDILFYPTYRRVEVGLDKVFLNRRNEYNRYELSPKYIGFGMNDVKNRISNVLNKMRKDANTAYIEMNANIISELLKKNVSYYLDKYNPIDLHKVDVIIKRIGEERIDNIDSLKSFLDKSSREKTIPNIEFLSYYLQKLVKIYDAQKPLDSKLRKFSDVCTKYLSGKKIIYDETLLTMNVYDCNDEKIDFEDLSSGEKQVISIFSKVYLDVVTPCIFIIDEPEISLSIEWQKEFLKDIFLSLLLYIHYFLVCLEQIFHIFLHFLFVDFSLLYL